MSLKKITTQETVLIALCAAMLGVFSQISFVLPGGIPMTLQTFGVVIIGILLGPKLGTFSIFIYILMGTVGIPVFSNFNSGLGVILGPAGGYIIGFLPMVFVIGLSKRRKFALNLFASLLGLILCHACGLLLYYKITHSYLPTTPILFIKDFITSILAVSIARELNRRLDFLFLSWNKKHI